MQIEITRLNRPVVFGNVIVGECAAVELDGDLPGLAGSEAHFGKSLQLFLRTGNTGMPVADINLCDFRSRTASGIREFKAHFDGLACGSRRRSGEILVSKCGVGKAIAERKQRLDSRFV